MATRGNGAGGENLLYYGDNLDVLRRHVADESVDLVYLDPPFNSNADYNVLFAEHGTRSAAQIKAFGDTWHWDEAAAYDYAETVEAGGAVSLALQAFRTLLGTSDMLAYLAMMAPRLVELRRVMKPTASIYLHCDSTASHYLKLLMDAIFGPVNFQNEVTWKRTTAHNDPKRFGRIQDRLLYYSKSKSKIFQHVGGTYSPEQLARYKYEDAEGRYKAENLTAPHYSKTRTVLWRGVHPGPDRQWRYGIDELERLYAEGRILLRRDGLPRKDGLKEYLSDNDAPALQDLWTDIGMGPTDGERLGYPTQKPEALLDRIIKVSSHEGDVVLDPFCGCGTSVASAQRLGRRWIGIDITHLAIGLIKHRLVDAHGLPVIRTFSVIGEPTDLAGAHDLAASDPFQFQAWALGLVGARLVGSDKKGADQGIDGRLFFHDEGAGSQTKQIIFSVKAGKTGAAHVRDLVGVLDREHAQIGVLLSMQKPTQPMRAEAAAAGFYKSPAIAVDSPRVQLLSIEGLFDGTEHLQYPSAQGNVTLRRAPAAKVDQPKTGRLPKIA